MAKKGKQELKNNMQGIANLIQYSEEYPKGAIKIGYHYYNASALIEALQDLRIRFAVGDVTKSDKILMEILAGII
jgi:hypothetical protein